MVEKIHVFDANLQKQLLSDYDLNSKSREWAKLTADKKSLITIIYRQCNDYAADHGTGNITNSLKRLRTIYHKSDDGSLSYKPYKVVVAVKSLHNISNSKPSNFHAFKEELKIKFDAVLAISRKFPNRIGVMEL